jgi:acylphosphatase
LATRLEILVQGRVQGVAFRWYAREQAQQLGVTGTVRNLPDGSVRIVAEGKREALEALLIWARQGPPHAFVRSADARWSAAQGDFTDFLITG